MMRSKSVAIVGVQLLLISLGCKDTTRTATKLAATQPTTQVAEEDRGPTFFGPMMMPHDFGEQEFQYRAKASPALRAIEQALAGSSDEKLLAMFHGDALADGDAQHVDYYVARDGNRMIEYALRKRALLARPALEAHKDDARTLFTVTGKPQTVGALCSGILKELTPPAAASRDQQLIIAAYNGDLPAVRKLLSEGADVNARYGDVGQDVFHNYPLTAAQWTALLAVSKSDRAVDQFGVVKALVEAGARVTLFDDHGYSAFHEAVFNDRFELAKYLLDHGADINARASEGGYTPVHHALHNPQMLDLLLARGADVNSKNDYGDAPIYFAVRDGDLDTVKKLIKAGADVNVQDDRGEAPLHVVRQTETARLLLASGARLDLKDKSEFTPLMKVEWSVESIELERAAYLKSVTPPPGYVGGWHVFIGRDPDLERLEQQGVKGSELARRLNDLRSTETKAIAGILKTGGAGPFK